MQTVSSADGTSIAYERHGRGPPVLLLHGSSGTRRVWDGLRPHLEDDVTCLVPDRRGRGESGDADEYGLAREVADVRALLDAVDAGDDEDVTVFGHSFGGLVALAAAADGAALDRLVLYEPAILVGEHRGDDLADRMRDRLNAGDRRDAMALFLEEAGGVRDVERLPWWPDEATLHLLETVVRENRAVETYELPSNPDVSVPTLLLTGERGPTHLRDGAFALEERLPESRLVELDGVGHVAVESAPDRVAAAVRSFALES